MIGKSYDGTFANGVAATGVEGLKTIVPICAISAWYNYSRTGGIRHNTNYPAASTSGIDRLERRRPACACRSAARSATALWRARSATTPTVLRTATVTRTATSTSSGATATTTRTRPRSRRPCSSSTASRTTTSAWTTSALWWDALRPTTSRTKMWLLRAGHDDPFESAPRRVGRHAAPLVRPLALRRQQRHRRRARASRSRTRRTSGATTPTGPSRARRTSTSTCARPARPTPARSAAIAGAGATDTLTFTAHGASSETTLMDTPSGSQTTRRVFLSNPLKATCASRAPPAPTSRAALGSPASNLSVAHRRLRRRHAGVQAAATASTLDHHRHLLGRRHRRTTRARARRSATPARSRTIGRSRTPATSTRSSRRPTSRSGASRAASWTPRTATRCWYADASDVVPGEFNRYGFPTAADRAHLQGRPPDRDHRRRRRTRAGPRRPAARTTSPVTLDADTRARSRCRSSAATAR